MRPSKRIRREEFVSSIMNKSSESSKNQHPASAASQNILPLKPLDDYLEVHYSESDDETPPLPADEDFQHKLRQWAIKHEINNDAFRDLLSILSEKMSDIPRDTQTPNRTSRETTPIDDGKNVQCGLKDDLIHCMKIEIEEMEEISAPPEINRMSDIFRDLETFTRTSRERTPLDDGEYAQCCLKDGVIQNIKREIEETEETCIPTKTNNTHCVCAEPVLLEIGKLRTEMHDLFTKLTSEIRSLPKELRAASTTSETSYILEDVRLPFATLQELEEFESKLVANSEKIKELQIAFLRRGIDDSKKFVKQNLQLIFRDEVAQEFTWLGANNKRCVKNLRIIMAMKNGFHEKFPGISEKTFELLVMKHFQYAKDRLMKKDKYEEMKQRKAEK